MLRSLVLCAAGVLTGLWGSLQGGPGRRGTGHPTDEPPLAGGPKCLESGRTEDLFQSDRSGFQNIHVMAADGTGVRQVTRSDVAHQGNRAVVQAWDTLYVIDLSRPGSSPTEVSITAPEDSPDRTTLQAVVVRGSDDWKPRPSPDRTLLAFQHHRGDVQILDLHSGEFRSLVMGLGSHH